MKKKLIFWIVLIAILAVATTILYYVSRFGLRWIFPVMIAMVACVLWRRSHLISIITFCLAVMLALGIWVVPWVASTLSNNSAAKAADKNAGTQQAANSQPAPKKQEEKKQGDVTPPACPVLLDKRTPENCPEEFQKKSDDHQNPGKDPGVQTPTPAPSAPMPAATASQNKNVTVVSPLSGGNYTVDVLMEDTCHKSRPGHTRCFGFVIYNGNGKNAPLTNTVTFYGGGATDADGNHFDIEASYVGGGYSNTITIGTPTRFSAEIPSTTGPISLTVQIEWDGSGPPTPYVFAKESALNVP